jgi:hypothetical protein
MALGSNRVAKCSRAVREAMYTSHTQPRGMLNGLPGANRRPIPGVPRDCPNGWLGMLGAYLDDSGSHSTSDIVIAAAVAGTEAELRSLEWLWRKELDAPLEGLKPRLSRFHMTVCTENLIRVDDVLESPKLVE